MSKKKGKDDLKEYSLELIEIGKAKRKRDIIFCSIKAFIQNHKVLSISIFLMIAWGIDSDTVTITHFIKLLLKHWKL